MVTEDMIVNLFYCGNVVEKNLGVASTISALGTGANETFYMIWEVFDLDIVEKHHLQSFRFIVVAKRVVVVSSDGVVNRLVYRH